MADDFSRYKSTQADLADAVKRGVWGEVEDVADAGRVMRVRGTNRTDYEIPLINFGYSFNLPTDSDAEIIMLSLGSDVNDRVGLPTLPRNLQYGWGEGEGGVQHPTDPARRIEFNANETWHKDTTFVYGDDKPVVVTITGSDVVVTMAGDRTVTITGDDTVTVQGNMTVNVVGNTVVNTTGTTDVNSTGDLTVTAPNVEITSATLTHNGVNVGSTHRHTDTPGLGAGNTSGPF